MLACDFFTIETATVKTRYVLFFIELGTLHVSGCPQHPDLSWVAQQARQLCWNLDSCGRPMRFLIHDNDTTFTTSFDAVFQSTGLEIIHTPLHAPNANAIAERFVRTVRQECLDQLVILNERHLRRVLKEYADFYSTRRPHQGLAQQCPVPLVFPSEQGSIQRRDVLGGIVHDYRRAA
jgi:transposase InsO family protein